jgi:hypothetical protein
MDQACLPEHYGVQEEGSLMNQVFIQMAQRMLENLEPDVGLKIKNKI